MKQLIDNVAEKFSVTKKQAKEMIEFIFDGVLGEAKADGKVKTSLGTFTIKDKAARDGRNPKTGETIKIPAKRVLTFKAPKSVNESL